MRIFGGGSHWRMALHSSLTAAAVLRALGRAPTTSFWQRLTDHSAGWGETFHSSLAAAALLRALGVLRALGALRALGRAPTTSFRQRLTNLSARWGALVLVILAAPVTVLADVDRRTLNNGNLVLEDIPEIPVEVVVDLMRYQNIRAAGFRAFTPDGNGIYVSTGFGDVDSLHRVDMPGGARNQLTFYREPVSQVTRRPGGAELLFARDAGGNEFSQIFAFDPATGDANMLTDGESRNGAMVWE